MAMRQPFQYIFGNAWRHAGFVIMISIIFAGIFSHGAIFSSVKSFAIGSLWSATIWLTQWYGNRATIRLLDNKIPWVEKPGLRLALGIPAVILYSTSAIIIVNLIFESIMWGFPENFWTWAYYTARTAVIIALIISTIFTTASFFRNWQEREVEAEKLSHELTQYKYEALRQQVNPHFLFNSFNVLSDLVHEDQDLAVKFIRQMSDVYRYVLDSRDKELTGLSDELEFIEKFVFLLDIRFGKNLQVKVDIDDRSGLVVPMALQMLVENAVKHNVVTSEKPLHVLISRTQSGLNVSNNLQLKNTVESSSNFGLSSIRQRYKPFTEQEVEVSDDLNSFSVTIPILQKDESGDH